MLPRDEDFRLLQANEHSDMMSFRFESIKSDLQLSVVWQQVDCHFLPGDEHATCH